jgi:hypothetical protein
VAYEREFGSSDDIFLDDVGERENEIAGQGAAPDDMIEIDDPEAVYEAYRREIEKQDEDEDEFEQEFEDIDPKTLAELIG